MNVTFEAQGNAVLGVGEAVRLSLTNGLTLFARVGKWAVGVLNSPEWIFPARID